MIPTTTGGLHTMSTVLSATSYGTRKCGSCSGPEDCQASDRSLLPESAEALVAYASRTGTRRNLEALWAAGWRLLLSSEGVHRCEGFRYAIDNGAWTAHQQSRPWDAGKFLALCARYGVGADWVVVPDIVEGGIESLRWSELWLPRLEGVGERRLIAVQDGMAPNDVRPLLGVGVGLFLGGSTDWKLATAAQWGQLAWEVGCYYHIGRVNSGKRIALCAGVGAHSFDGTSTTRYAKTLRPLDTARRQTSWVM